MKLVLSQKHKINIPSNIAVFYSSKKKTIIFKETKNKKSLKLNVKILISKSNNYLVVTAMPFLKTSNNEKKKLKAKQGATVALIRQTITELNAILYIKLKFIGVGYRVFNIETFKDKILMLKLGYSHPIYLKILNNLTVFCFKFTKLFIFGASYQKITILASEIRRNKKPEPYKGKGILYENEKIILKEGKKI